MTKELDTREIRAACEKATPGPWGWFNAYGTGRLVRSTRLGHSGDASPNTTVATSKPQSADIAVLRADAEFIAKSREWVPALCDALDKARTERDEAVRLLRVSQKWLPEGTPSERIGRFLDRLEPR